MTCITNKKQIAGLLIVIVPVMIVLSWLQSCDTQKDPQQLGFIGTLSGKYSDLGLDVLEGMQLAIQEVNEQGGVKGRLIELVVKDDGGKPDQAIDCAKSLLKQGVGTIVGPNLSSVAVKLVPWCTEHNMLLVSPTVSTSLLAGIDDSLIRIIPHNGYHSAKSMAEFVKNKMQLDSGVILYDQNNAAYAEDIVLHTERALRELGVEIKSTPFNAGKNFDYGTMVRQTVSAEIDFVYLISSALDSAMFCWQLKKQQCKPAIFVRDWALTDEFYRVGNEAVEGVILLTSAISLQETEVFNKFSMKMQERTPRKSGKFMVYGYEAAQVVLTCLVADIGNLKQAILSIKTFQGLQDEFVIDSFGDVQRPVFSVRIEEGEIVPFNPQPRSEE